MLASPLFPANSCDASWFIVIWSLYMDKVWEELLSVLTFTHYCQKISVILIFVQNGCKLCRLLLDACVVDISKNQFWRFLSIVFSLLPENYGFT